MTGDVDPPAVRAAAERVFESWPDAQPANSPQPSPSPKPKPDKDMIVFNAGGPSVRAGFLLRAPKGADPGFATMSMLNAILGGGSGADTRLYREVRTRRGLVYAIGSAYNANEGELYVGFESTKRNFAAARTAVRDVVDELRTGTISTEERDRAYRKLLVRALRRQAVPDEVLDDLGSLAQSHRAPGDAGSLAALYAAISPGDLERFARTALRLDHATEFEEGFGH